MCGCSRLVVISEDFGVSEKNENETSVFCDGDNVAVADADEAAKRRAVECKFSDSSKNAWFNKKPPEERSPFWWLRWVPTVVVSVAVLYFLYVVGSVAIVPVLASFALAYLFNPIVYQAEKRGLSRTCRQSSPFCWSRSHRGFYGVCRSRFVGGKHESRFENRRKFHAGKRRAAESVLGVIRPRWKKWRAIKSSNF
jgi:hypothetical protein